MPEVEQEQLGPGSSARAWDKSASQPSARQPATSAWALSVAGIS